MPTAAQRQRAAAAAVQASAAGAINAALTHPRGHNQRSSNQKQRYQQASQAQLQQQKAAKQQISQPQPQQTTKSQIKPEMSEESAFSDEDSEEDETAIAFEMDSQDLWTQNFCATCDCLIEPGQGVGPATRRTKSDGENAPRSPTSPLATSRQALPTTSSFSGLKSKSGTIKARPASSEGSTSTTTNMKRTHSAGKLHAAGGAGILGPHKRTGSAAGRLNALSELRPTTKLDSDGTKNTQRVDNLASTSTKKNSSLPRHNSESQNGNQSNGSSRATSPVSPSTSNLPRSKKGGLIAANVRKFEEEVEEMNAKAPAALYCSERCRGIDEQRSSDLGELVYYLHQPAPTSPTWNNGSNLMSNSYNSWSNRNLSMAYRDRSSIGTPESECTCADCMDRHNGEGAVPSGASDTTESSASYHFNGRKQRTQSGRIVTPQNLAAPGGHGTDYFGWAASRKGQQQKQKQRRSEGTTDFSEGDNYTGDYSTEVDYRRVEDASNADRRAQINVSTTTSPRTMRNRGASIASDEAYGATTAGTVTPAANRNSPEETNDSSLGMPNMQGMNISQATARSSPLRLIRRGDLHAQASVDISGDLVKSQQTYPSSLLSHSVASEQTEMAASSGITLSTLQRTQSPSVQTSSSLLNERRKDTLESPIQPVRMTNSPMPIENGTSTSSAIGTLKNAQLRAMQDEVSHPSLEERRQSVASTTSSSGSWLRASISSAWNSLRGYPQSGTNSSDDFSSVDEHHSGSRRNSSSSSAASRFSAVLPHGLGAMTPIAVNHDDPTPTQSQISRPHTKRGNIPAFATEIGRGSIPGEQQLQVKDKSVSVYGESQETPSHFSKSHTSAHYSSDEERRRRRMEKERKQKHQRSKDVTVLPPLLGVSRTASSVNLSKTSRPSHYTHASYGSSSSNIDAISQQYRPRAGSQSQGLTAGHYPVHPVGSVGSINGLSRPVTPGIRKNSSSTVTLAAPELASSPSGRMMGVGSFGSSPRRAGLGWGAMSTITIPDVIQMPSMVSRPSSHAPHRHHHSQHHHHHNPSGVKTPSISSGGGGGNGNRQTHRHSGGASSNNLLRLGHVGLLGAHPHGSGPIYGRHATTPVRSTTPRVPEDGGEMSGAALKGEDDHDGSTLQIPALHSQHRSSMMLQPPSRPQSSMSGRGISHADAASDQVKRSSLGAVNAQQRNMSSEDVRPVKLYPVLDVPNRKPTHDLYDTNWHLDGAVQSSVDHSSKATDQGNSQSRQSAESQQSQRKRLFYFDTT